MGISTSGSALVIFAAMFLAIGTLHGSTSTAVEAINGAETAQVSSSVAIQETSVSITTASDDTTTDVFTVKATNTGERPVAVEDLSVVADGAYVPRDTFETITVDGRDSRVWRPGSQLVLRDDDRSVATIVGDAGPNYVKLVTRDGVASLLEVTRRG